MNAQSMLNSESHIQAFRRRRGIKSALLRWLCYIAIAITVGSLLTIVAYICINGIPHLSWNLLFGAYSADNPSMGFAIVSTLELAALSILIAGPLGVGCAIYLCEYARRKSPLVSAIRLATETLSGIPSIISGIIHLRLHNQIFIHTHFHFLHPSFLSSVAFFSRSNISVMSPSRP